MYGSKRKRRLHSVAVLLGPLSFGLTILLLEWFFGFKAAAALGTTVWMALWWILRPVNISVTAFVPIGVNALFDLSRCSTLSVSIFLRSSCCCSALIWSA